MNMEIIEYREKELQLEIKEFEHLQRTAQALIQSGILPRRFNSIGSVIALDRITKELGINNKLLTAAQEIYTVNGNISLSGKMIVALLNSSKKFDHDMRWEIQNEGTSEWRVRAWNTQGDDKLYSEWLDEKIVIQSGWKRNPLWNLIPIRLAKYRTATYFGRDYAPEVLLGVREQHELEDTTVSTIAEPEETAFAVKRQPKEEIIEEVTEEIIDVKEEFPEETFPPIEDTTVDTPIEAVEVETQREQVRTRLPSQISLLSDRLLKMGLQARDFKPFITEIYNNWIYDTIEDVKVMVAKIAEVEEKEMLEMLENFYVRAGATVPDEIKNNLKELASPSTSEEPKEETPVNEVPEDEMNFRRMVFGRIGDFVSLGIKREHMLEFAEFAGIDASNVETFVSQEGMQDLAIGFNSYKGDES